MNHRSVTVRYRLRISAVVMTLLVSACSSTPVTVGKLPPQKYEKLGAVTGEACGTLGLFTTWLSFIPMDLNERVEDAYHEAIQSAPGATGLVNVEYKEDWFWWVIATTRCTTVSGDAIKELL